MSSIEEGIAVSNISGRHTDQKVITSQFNTATRCIEIADRLDCNMVTLESIEGVLQKQLDKNITLDISSHDMISVTLEHLGVSDITVTSTLSLERLSEKISTFAEAAKQLLKKIWMATKTFMADIFKYGSSLIKRADSISTYATNKPNDSVVPIKLLFANKLEVNGKVPAKQDLLMLYSRACPDFDNVSSVINAQIEVIANMIDTLLDGKKTEVERTLAIVNQKFIGIKTALDNTLSFQRAKIDFKEVSVSGVKGKHVMPGLVIDSKGMDARGTDSHPYVIDSLTSTEVLDVTKLLKAAVEALDSVKKQYTEGYLNSKINRLADREVVTSTDKKAINTDNASKIISKSIRMLLKFNNKYIMYMMGIHKAMLDYCAQSIKAK